MASQPGRETPTQLQFNDAPSCVAWLESVPLTHAPHAHEMISAQIVQLNGSTIPAIERLKILEALREPIAYVQSELAKKFLGKPIPLSIAEFSLWRGVVELWQSLHFAYRQCLHAYRAGESDLGQFGPLVCVRAMHYTALGMLDHFRVYREVPSTLWEQLHQIYAFAESRGFASLRTDDGAHDSPRPVSCSTTYTHALLTYLANPYALSSRQMELMFRWLDRWDDTIGFSREPLPSTSGPPLAVDLRSAAPAMLPSALDAGAEARYLNFEQLSKTLRRLLGALRAGQTPQQLGLGQDLRQPGCEKLLTLLYIQWCGAGTGRINERTQTAKNVMVCLGIEAAHYHISGKPFRPPGAPRTREEEADLHLFGHVSERTLRTLVSQRSSALESWQLVNQSAAGFLGLLRTPDLEMRISHLQLIAIMRDSGAPFQAGVVQWMKLEENGELFVGVRLLPGVPKAVAVRQASVAAVPSQYEKALILPEAPELQAPASLLLAPGTFRSGNFLDLYTDREAVIKLSHLLERGTDFERADFIVPH